MRKPALQQLFATPNHFPIFVSERCPCIIIIKDPPCIAQSVITMATSGGVDEIDEFVYRISIRRRVGSAADNWTSTFGGELDKSSGFIHLSKLHQTSVRDTVHGDEHSEIIQWLDKKSKSSTVFVSFGSEYFLSKEEIEEIELMG